MKNLILVLGLSVYLSTIAQQESEFVFSLEQAKKFAIENNLTVKNSELDIEAAKKQVWETTAIGLPHVNGTYNFQYIPGDIPTIQFDPNMPPIELGVAQSATYDVTVSQLIFSGEYIVGLQASKTFLELSKNANDKNINDLKENVSTGYFTILALEKNKEIADSSISNLKNLVAETKAYVETGFMEDTELEQMQITLNTVSNMSNMLKRQVEISYKLFKILFGIELEKEVKLTETLESFLLKIDSNGDIEFQFDINNNIDYKIVETNEHISQLSLRREKSTFLPTVSAFYLYQDKTNKADFDITFNNILGFSVAVPIFSSGQKMARVSQAKIELEQSQNLKDQVSNTIMMGVDQAKYDFKNAYETYLTERANLDLTNKIYDKTVIKYKEGMASGMELTQANNQYLESSRNHVSAILNLLNAKIRLEKAINNL